MRNVDKRASRTGWHRLSCVRTLFLLPLVVGLVMSFVTFPSVLPPPRRGPSATSGVTQAPAPGHAPSVSSKDPVEGKAEGVTRAQWRFHAAQRPRALSVSWKDAVVGSGPLPAPLHNDVARSSIMNIDEVHDTLGLYGQGQIIAVADSGLDTGDTATVSADFAGRLRQAFAWGRPGDWSDPNGHGTHVAGSALGSGVLSGSDPANRHYAGSFAGVAPQAELVFQSLLDTEGGLGGLPDDLQDLLRQAYDAGARVHTNSWGANFFIKPLARFLTTGQYTAESAQVDRFVWEHRDMVVLFAAGNEGVDFFAPAEQGLELPLPDGIVDPDSLASPGTAKNVITVGASEGLSSTGGHAQERWGKEGDLLSAVMGYSYTAEPIASDLPSDNPDGMAPFSSHGPSSDGRIKPDVVAPGTNIISARSHASGSGDLFGAYDEHYAYCSGTSMATPLVAGAVTLIRQWYVDQQSVSNPSAALIKATLINGATDISPGQFGRGPTQDVPDAWPNSVTGWGRVNLKASLSPGAGREVWFTDEQQGLDTGQEAIFTRYAGEGPALSVAKGTRPLRVTLVWTDPPGPVQPEDVKIPGITQFASPVLINDLDLTVETPDGRRFQGNMRDAPDRLNNVEAVRIASPPAGEFRIVVRGHHVPQGPQPFALVVAGQRVVSGPDEAEQPAGAVAETGEEGVERLDGWLIPLLAGMGGVIVLLGGALVYLQTRRQSSAARRPAAAHPRSGTQSPEPIGLPPASLLAERGPLAGTALGDRKPHIPVHRSPFAIGRNADNDLVLSDEPVSRRHARLEGQEGRWFLQDLESANGTFLNRQRLVGPQPLHSGDLIGIGSSVFVFTQAAPPPTRAGPEAAAPRPPARSSTRSRLVIGIALGAVLLLLVVAAVLLFSGQAAKEKGTAPLPGLPGIELPSIDLPTVQVPTIELPAVDLPTLEVPTIALPTGMPTVGAPTLAVPTGIPGMPPLPTIDLPVP